MQPETPKETEAVRAKRRRYTAAFKREVVDQTRVTGASVARIAREHGINANQVFKWRRQQLLAERGQRGEDAVPDTSVSLLPVKVISEKVPSRSVQRDGVIEITLGGAQIYVRGIVDKTTLDCVLSSLRR